MEKGNIYISNHNGRRFVISNIIKDGNDIIEIILTGKNRHDELYDHSVTPSILRRSFTKYDIKK